MVTGGRGCQWWRGGKGATDGWRQYYNNNNIKKIIYLKNKKISLVSSIAHLFLPYIIPHFHQAVLPSIPSFSLQFSTSQSFSIKSLIFVEALLEVATQLGKKGWNRNMNLCNETVTVLPPKPDGDNKVLCNCSFPGDLNGSLQKLYRNYHTLNNCKQCFKLLHFYTLSTNSIVSACRSLWANYLSGNIPPEWAGTKLELL
uniref:Uncharacterized protein n=1 Tax=Salix viminalis TaxID=40686 RepID=A0A6N2LXT2_SALVM